MDIGMLWFDNDKQADIQKKVERAAAYYRDKYGQVPNLCFVHPCMVPKNVSQEVDAEKPVMKSKGVEIRTSASMLPNHFWIGVA